MAKCTAAVVSDSRPNTVMILSERIDDRVAMGGLIDLPAGWKPKTTFRDNARSNITRKGGIYGVPAFTSTRIQRSFW